jgi:hypothetical protein
VLMPAPVKTTARFARSISRARAAVPLSLSMALLSQMCRDAPSAP